MVEQNENKLVQIVVGRDSDDLRKFGTKGTVCIGKHIVGSGEDAHLTTPVLMDVLRPHEIVVAGKRGSGKSFSLGVFVEELIKLSDEIRRNLCSVMIDTQGIFWTMKSPNEKDSLLLADWDVKPQGFPVGVYVPAGQSDVFKKAGVDFDGIFSVSADELSADDWLAVFELDANQLLGIMIQRVINDLKKTGTGYSLDFILEKIKADEGSTEERLALVNRFEAAKTWGIFGESKMPKMLEGGKTTIIDVSLTPQNVRTLLVSLVCRKIFVERTIARRKEELADTEGIAIKRTPMCWVMIDEAHNFIPNDGKTASLDILLKLVREGRQPGITLVFATQCPEKLHPDALAQCDLLISHMLTAKADIEALKSIMQTYMLFDITKYFNDLPKLKGVALILDDNSERIYTIRIRPRQSWHAGSSPVALKK